mmetsp:Transcript_58082/g.155225  ORF Transcript_58082/g.155225 Transcript_58082/m.155225 type:complete len:235 (-) Transcript_58082:450-1154(-)
MARRSRAASGSGVSCSIGSSSTRSRTSVSRGAILTLRAALAYPSTRPVSAASRADGPTQTIIWVTAEPDRELCSRRVRLESRNGARWVASPWARARMTRPRTRRPLLVPTPAESTVPWWALSMVSDPAKSTRVRREVWDLYSPGPALGGFQRCSTARIRIAWEREECACTPVAAVARAAAPRWITLMTPATEATFSSTAPSAYTRPSCSRRAHAVLASREEDAGPARRSKTFSQ